MTCCGSKRAQAARSFPTRRNTPPPFTPPAPKLNAISIRYTGERGLSLRGSSSGRVYVFATHGTTLEIDPRDAEILLRIRAFERA